MTRFRWFPALLFLLTPGAARLPAQDPVHLPGTLRIATPGDAPDRLIVFYRGPIPSDTGDLLSHAGASHWQALPHLGAAILQVAPEHIEKARTALAQDPSVQSVLDDHLTHGYTPLLRIPAADHEAVLPYQSRETRGSDSFSTVRLVLHPSLPAGVTPSGSGTASSGSAPISPDVDGPDAYFDSPQEWAVQQAGGFGSGVPGGPVAGPWNTSMGAGVRIAILDSGVDPTHPDLAPNLVYNLSEVDQAALPSPCDDGSPVDQQGHGTWVASLAAAAIGGGEAVGVAPQASILNVKVLERLPSATGVGTTAQCEAGQASGLLSWTLQGIEDAITAHADVISVSLGTLVDTSTGDGAGWVAAFNQVTYAAEQAGVVIVAAAGNDGLDLAQGTLAELPAQARGVLAVTASTNPECAENLTPGATCGPGPVTRAYYSNHGANLNAIAAPGGSYPSGSATGVSGWIRGACSSGLPHTSDGLPGSQGRSFGCFNLGHQPYVQAMGTSASAPLVAGAAAILHAARPGWTAAQIISALRSSATPLGSMAEPELNLAAALALP